jgi:hypothetical protein
MSRPELTGSASNFYIDKEARKYDTMGWVNKRGREGQRGRDYFRGIQTQECSQNIALKLR